MLQTPRRSETGRPKDRPVLPRPVSIHPEWRRYGESGDDGPDLAGTGRGRRGLPPADRAAPPRAPGPLLPDARLAPGRRGRPAGDAAGRLAGPRRVRGARLAADLALPDRHQPLPQRAPLGSRRQAKEWDVPGVDPPEPTRLGEVVWLEPLPDALLEAPTTPARGPLRAAGVDLAGLRHRAAAAAAPPARRAASCATCSASAPARWPRCSDSTVESVNSALKRARAGLRAPAAAAAEHEPPPAPDSAAEEALVERFVRAYEAGDIDALVDLLTDDVFISMPPMPLEYEGRELVARFCAGIFRDGRRFDLVAHAGQRPAGVRRLPPRAPTASATAPAVSCSPSAATGSRAMTRFENSVLPVVRAAAPASPPPRHL